MPVSAARNTRPSELDQGIDIIELLAGTPGGLTTSAIATRLKRRLKELDRVVAVMEQRGWLRSDPETSRYRVAYHVLGLAYQGLAARSLTSAAAPVMRVLAARINLPCQLVVQSGAQGAVVAQHGHRHQDAFASATVGTLVELVSSCPGRLLLANLSELERKEIMNSSRSLHGSRRAALTRGLAKIRRRGFELRPSRVSPGVVELSYPIRAIDGSVAAALSVPFLKMKGSSIGKQAVRIQQVVELAARHISHALGWME